MGRRRGQRNRAKEKFWPGQDAAIVRADKHGAVAQEAEHLIVDQEDAGSRPVGPASITEKELAKLRPESVVALAVRRASAEGTYVLPKVKRLRRNVYVDHSKAWRGTQRQKDTLGEFHWDNIGRAHYLILLLQATNHYALPTFMHECDPEEIMMIAERMDLWKATVERMYRKAA